MDAIDNLLQQLRLFVPAFDATSIPRDSTGVYASSVHLIAGLLSVNPTYVKRQLDCGKIIANINENCTLTKLVGVRNRLLAGNAESLVRVLASCNRPEIRSIVAKLSLVPSVAPGPQALSVAPGPQAFSVTPCPQAFSVAPGPQAPSVAPSQRTPFFTQAPAHIQENKKPLVLNGIVIEVDPTTLMINATQMCQAAGKLFADYSRSVSTTEFLQTLSSNMGIPIINLVCTKPGHNGGTVVHRIVAYDLARWCMGNIAVQFMMWIDELMLNGRVELGNEMNTEKLDAIWKRRIAEEQAKTWAADNSSFLREKHARELLAIDEDQAAKRKREDAAVEDEKNERATKRQREDAKCAEESRMKMVLFDAEVAERQSNYAKSLIDLRAIFVPKLTACLEQSLPNNAHLRSAINDIEVNLVRKISKCITGDGDHREASGFQETLYCHDFQTFLREMGRPVATTSELSKLGKFIATKYRKLFGKDPDLVEKYINGDNRPVKTYKVEHKDFIEKSIKEFYDQVTTPATETAPDASVAKSPKDMRSFFGPLNMSQMHFNISCEK